MFKTIDIVEKNGLNVFRKGEKPIFGITTILGFGAVGTGIYFVVKYVLPAIFIMLGQIFAPIITGLAVLLFIFNIPNILKLFRMITRVFHKALIRHDPFGELWEGVQKMYTQLTSIKESISKIAGLEKITANKAIEYENLSKQYAEQINNATKRANKLKEAKQVLVQELGSNAQHDDRFVKMYLEETELLAASNNMIRQKKQAEDLIVKYGMRHDRMKKTRHKLEKVFSATKIKISETETSVKILEVDYKFAKEGAAATKAALDATKGFDGDWSTQYAIEVATNSIAADLQEMSMNLKEIDSIANNFDLDNDTMYEKLLQYTEEIKVKDPISSERYLKGNFTPTHEEKTISGLNDLF